MIDLTLTYNIFYLLYSFITPYVAFNKEIQNNKITTYKHKLKIQFPTKKEITKRVLTTIILDIPWFIIKNFYNYPIPTIITLYSILPQDIFYYISYSIIYYTLGKI